jgi:hypothetical protein
MAVEVDVALILRDASLRSAPQDEDLKAGTLVLRSPP